MSEYKEKKMSYGFYGDFMTYNPVQFTEQGAQILWTYPDGSSRVRAAARGWLLGEADDFKESGQYDIVLPEEGIVSVHWDHLQPIIVPTV